MLRLPRFRYVSPPTIEEAIRLRTEHLETSMYVAGGTDVYPKMKRRQFQPELVVSLGRLVHDGFANGAGMRIGAGVTLTAVSANAKIQEGYRALAEAASAVSTPQLRNMGTIGGNVCLDTRCNWYDQSLFWRTAEGFCMKTHPNVVCRVATSSPRCLAVASADTVPALIALGATARIASADGERTVPVAELYREDGIRYLTLRRDEIVTEIVLPTNDGWTSTYLKARDRGSFDFPIVGLAAAVRMDAGRVAEARVALTAVASRPILVEAAGAALRGTRLEDEAIEAAAEAAFKAARPMDNTSGTIAQRKRTVSVFAARALRELREPARAAA